MLRIRDRLYEIYATQTGQTRDRIAADCDRNKWLDEREMLEYGLVDKVLTKMPQIDRKREVED
jgi:ATP-dependent Clp protease protease subunit